LNIYPEDIPLHNPKGLYNIYYSQRDKDVENRMDLVETVEI
jgi:hypothetical protein